VLAFAAQDWQELTGNPFPSPRTLDDLRKDAAFQSDCADAIVAAIPFGAGCEPRFNSPPQSCLIRSGRS
jgi:hypothetical protein